MSWEAVDLFVRICIAGLCLSAAAFIPYAVYGHRKALAPVNRALKERGPAHMPPSVVQAPQEPLRAPRKVPAFRFHSLPARQGPLPEDLIDVTELPPAPKQLPPVT